MLAGCVPDGFVRDDGLENRNVVSQDHLASTLFSPSYPAIQAQVQAQCAQEGTQAISPAARRMRPSGVESFTLRARRRRGSRWLSFFGGGGGHRATLARLARPGDAPSPATHFPPSSSLRISPHRRPRPPAGFCWAVLFFTFCFAFFLFFFFTSSFFRPSCDPATTSCCAQGSSAHFDSRPLR